ncbi:hypothetical protein PTTG_03008 [Puccinia triticina 1-1 BBBD Race 1]|uniref:Uncharacterized protein n=1 Tax=Puccinia triticina (isolate 1-1 / race 1 (BBBD)) TaxID=630390 RepID=A0A0C4EQE9_PUCT1|nr:hypothetical protein PTTG_03008 [Puccinia triticina 1-1 BBBD Race 1]
MLKMNFSLMMFISLTVITVGVFTSPLSQDTQPTTSAPYTPGNARRASGNRMVRRMVPGPGAGLNAATGLVGAALGGPGPRPIDTFAAAPFDGPPPVGAVVVPGGPAGSVGGGAAGSATDVNADAAAHAKANGPHATGSAGAKGTADAAAGSSGRGAGKSAASAAAAAHAKANAQGAVDANSSSASKSSSSSNWKRQSRKFSPQTNFGP